MNIKSVFNKHCANLKIDQKLANAISRFSTSFLTKNEDHIAFFGSGLLGVYPVKWMDTVERQAWIDDILEIDEIKAEADFHALPSINPDFNVESDLVNNSIIYLMHRFENSSLPQKTIVEAKKNLYSILLYKFISSLMSHFFKYPSDEAVARTAYAQLSFRFDIKRLGTWSNLIAERAEDFIAPNSIHKNAIKTMNDDDGVTYALTDTQTRIREVIKSYSTVFYEVRDTDSRSFTTSAMIQLEDGLVVKDLRREFTTYSRYIHSVARDPSDFVRSQLLEIVLKIMSSANPDAVKATLLYMSASYDDKRKSHIPKFIDATILYAFGFISDKRISTSNLGMVLNKLRSMFTGSRIHDNVVLGLRETGDKIVIEARPTSKYPPAAERTAVLLYVVLRALTMHHFKQ